MQQAESKLKLFCADNTPLHPSNFIFDNTYKNMSQKRRFEHDPRFAYFNTLTKIKNNYINTNKSVYEYIFNQDSLKNSEDFSNMANFSRQINAKSYAPKQAFHIQKINNHSFKIYKNKRNQPLSFNKFDNSYQAISDLNFQVHFKGKGKFEEDKQKPKIELLLTQYKKLQQFRDRNNPERNSQSRFQRFSMKNDSNQKSKNSVTSRNNMSASSIRKTMKSFKKDQNKANMSHLALKISS